VGKPNQNTAMQVEILSDKDEPINIRAIIMRGTKGLRDYYGCPETPDDEDEIEIIASCDNDGYDVVLTSEEYERAIYEIIEEMRR